MLHECSAEALLRASGGDGSEVASVLLALSRLALDHPEVLEADVNPLFVGARGTVAADALIVLGGAATTAARGEGSTRRRERS
jgi:hypothetical protein